MEIEKVWLKKYPSAVPHELTHTPVSLPEFFAEGFQKNGSRVALHCLGNEMTYAELDKRSNHLAGYLQNVVGLKKGDRIALLLPNIIQFPVAFLAAQKLGLIVVAVNPQYTSKEILFQLNDSGAKCFLVLDLLADKLVDILSKSKVEKVIVTSIADQFPLYKSWFVSLGLRMKTKTPPAKIPSTPYKEALRIGAGKPAVFPKIAPSDYAVLQYTGGTTGISKGAILSHHNLVCNILQVQNWVGPYLIPGNETVLVALPTFHIFGLTVNFLTFLYSGDKMVLIPKPIPVENCIEAFAKFPISIMLGVNTLFNSMNNSKRFREIAPKNIKFALAGGMALQEGVARKWEEITGNRLLQGYGLTETSPVTHVVPLKDEYPFGTIGYPLSSTEAMVADEDGNPLPVNTPGELLIRGPQVMQGYWNRPEETEKVMVKGGWLRTGDIASVNEEGMFYIVDRKKDMILVSGFNVFPNEVEDVISLHPKVLEVAVIGIPHKASGEAVKAFIVPKKDSHLTEVEIKAFCKEQLASYKVPRRIEFREMLPKTNVGKVLRRELRAELQ